MAAEQKIIVAYRNMWLFFPLIYVLRLLPRPFAVWLVNNRWFIGMFIVVVKKS